MRVLRPIFLAWSALMCAVPAIAAEGEMSVAGAIQPVYAQSTAGVYNEYLSYSPYVKRSYVVGYAPKVSSLYENPRTYPNAAGRLGEVYLYANMAGWFFGSPSGYQTSVPPHSSVLAYCRGEQNITKNLDDGYPDGKKVIEPVLVPYAAYTREGGTLINCGAAPLNIVPSDSLGLGASYAPNAYGSGTHGTGYAGTGNTVTLEK